MPHPQDLLYYLKELFQDSRLGNCYIIKQKLLYIKRKDLDKLSLLSHLFL